MKILLACAVLLSAATGAFALDFTRISSENAFRTFVVDRVLVDEFGGRIELGQNGYLGGKIDSNTLRGGWAWRDGAFCRRLVIGRIDQGTDCQLVYIRANTLVFQGNRGHGSETAYTIYAKR